MASVEVSALSQNQKDTLALSYAALLCNSGEVDFDAQNVENICKAAGLKVCGKLIASFVNSLQGTKLSSLLTCGGGNAGSSAGATGGAAPVQQQAAAAEPEKEESEDGELGMDMFGF